MKEYHKIQRALTNRWEYPVIFALLLIAVCAIAPGASVSTVTDNTELSPVSYRTPYQLVLYFETEGQMKLWASEFRPLWGVYPVDELQWELRQ